MHLRDYLALARRNWLLIVSCTAIGIALGAISALTAPTMYQATTQLYISVRNTGAATDLAQSTAYARQAVTSYVEVVPTALVLEPVIEELGLDETPGELARRVSAAAPLNTQVISITVRDSDPSQAAQVANAAGESFQTAVATALERPAADGEQGKVRAETVAPARVPIDPYSPNLPLSLSLGLLLGLAAGLAVAVVRAVLDTRVHVITDVEAVLEAPILGGIPFDPDSAKRPLIVLASPRDPRSEAFRRVRTNLQFLAYEGGAPSFVITSSAPAEGKSTTCANLALTLAETGARVALIDADLRKPRVADVFNLEGGVGLSDVLAGRITLSCAIQPWGAGKLFVLPAGTLPPNPAELLGSRGMWRLLEELRQAFDYILIDAPPLLAVTDAAVISRLTTGAIMVAASGSTRKPQLESARKALESVDAKLLGAIITKLPTRGPDSYGYGQYTYGVTHATP